MNFELSYIVFKKSEHGKGPFTLSISVELKTRIPSVSQDHLCLYVAVCPRESYTQKDTGVKPKKTKVRLPELQNTKNIKFITLIWPYPHRLNGGGGGGTVQSDPLNSSLKYVEILRRTNRDN